ncbi:hypothetical protein MMC06_004791 [Schaereria dolodes]|nr:hypothetical protein [Schaereria dolodes]
MISTVELRYALQYALYGTSLDASDAVNATQANRSPQRSSPVFRKLVEEIEYSRRFVVSYEFVLAAILLAFTAVHWGTKLSRCDKRRRATKEGGSVHSDLDVKSTSENTVNYGLRGDGGSVSSSITLNGTTNLSWALKHVVGSDEHTWLLPKSWNAGSSTRTVGLKATIRSWLVYQPRPIPIVHKTLPSNAVSIAVLVLYAINIFYTFYKVTLSVPLLFVFADRTSLLVVANLPMLYLFAAKNQPIRGLTGYSYESLNILHRRIGEIMCLLALLHSLGMTGVWYSLLRPTGFSLARFLLSKIILLGIGALICYECLYFTSLGYFRQHRYELFLGIHIILQVAALILVWFHHHGSRTYIGIALAIFLIDRLIYRMVLKVKTFGGLLKVEDDRETVSVHINLPLSSAKGIARTVIGCNVNNGWKATEHVFVTIPTISKKHIIQAHPFTIASKAPSANAMEANLDLIIRAQDGFSADLLKYAKGHETVPIRIDGPYGSQAAVELLKNSDVSVVIAGGSGFAVAWPLIWSVLDQQKNKDPELQAMSSLPKKILFIWIVHKQAHLNWIGQERLDELRQHKVEVYIPPATAENGRPDIKSLFEPWAVGCDLSLYHGRAKIGVVCSGPDGMNKEVRNICASLLQRGRDVRVEIEKFGW